MRGTIPCDILFVGEAPGASEDVLGKPFMGPAGKLLDKMIGDAGYNVADHDMLPTSYAFTNLIACIPMEDGEKVGEPPKESVEACAPRLRQFITICRPRVIICVGELAKRWLPKILENRDEGARRQAERATSVVGRGRAVGATQRGVAAKDVGSGNPRNIRLVSIIHPAAILRADVSQRGLAIQKTIVTLVDVLDSLK